MPIYCTRKITRTKYSEHKYITIRSLRNYTQEKFWQALRDKNFPDYSTFANVNEAYDDFVLKLTEVIDAIAPYKKVKVKGNTKDWFDDEIHSAIKTRDKKFAAFKKSRLHNDNISYKN